MRNTVTKCFQLQCHQSLQTCHRIDKAIINRNYTENTESAGNGSCASLSPIGPIVSEIAAFFVEKGR